eukprot:755558-Hanusia_phi.AAC.4
MKMIQERLSYMLMSSLSFNRSSRDESIKDEIPRCFLWFPFLLLSVQAPDVSEGDIVPREKKDLLVIGSSVSVEEAAERSC